MSAAGRNRAGAIDCILNKSRMLRTWRYGRDSVIVMCESSVDGTGETLVAAANPRATRSLNHAGEQPGTLEPGRHHIGNGDGVTGPFSARRDDVKGPLRIRKTQAAARAATCRPNLEARCEAKTSGRRALRCRREHPDAAILGDEHRTAEQAAMESRAVVRAHELPLPMRARSDREALLCPGEWLCAVFRHRSSP